MSEHATKREMFALIREHGGKLEESEIRASRPADVGPGSMFSLCGVDVYEGVSP